MTQPSGNLITNDGDNDGYYDNNQDCVWTVIAPPTKVIRLEFHTFELEGGSGCKHDYVRVSINPGKETPSKRAHAVEMTPDRRQYDKVITTHRHWHNRLITTSWSSWVKNRIYFIPGNEFNAYLKQIKVKLSAMKKYRIFAVKKYRTFSL